MYFLDTNVCVAFFRNTSEALSRRLLACSPSKVCVPAIVEAELLLGARKSARVAENLAVVRSFLVPLDVVPFDRACAEQCSVVRADLEKSGAVIGPNDLMIAATVLASGGVLVTHNVAEFSRVAGLRLVDWQIADA